MRKLFLILIALLSLGAGVHAQAPLFPVNSKYLGYAGTGGGTANVQTVTYTPATTVYTTGQVVSWKPGTANTSATTVNVDTLGAKSVVKINAAALVANDLLATTIAYAYYDGTNMVLLNPQTGLGCTGQPALTSDVTSSAGSCTTTVANVAGTAAATIKIRSFGTTFGDTTGSTLSSGSVVYLTVPYACTIAAWNISVDAGTGTVDIWKIATGTAVPTVSNTITASALPAISTGTSIHSTTLTGWTTSVAANDIFGFQLNTVATSKFLEIDVQCNQ